MEKRLDHGFHKVRFEPRGVARVILSV